jgi:hypothetical protein
MANKDIVSEVQDMLFPSAKSLPHEVIFTGLSFVLVGNIPLNGRKRWTQNALEKEVKAHGGTVSKNLPGQTKGRSTKKYFILVNSSSLSKKVPDIIREAVSRGYIILDYSFVFECLERKCLVDQKLHEPDIS